MKKLLFFSFLLLALTGCFRDRLVGSGSITSETRSQSSTNFNTIRIQGGMDVVIKQGDLVKVVASDYENLLPYLETRLSGNTLVIDYRDNAWISNSAGKVTITMPKLVEVELNGSGDVSTDGHFRFDDLLLNISGSGDFNFAGSAKKTNIRISGSGDIRAFDMPCDSVRVIISGSGNVQVNVKDILDATISGSGDIVYKGNPSVNSQVTGSGRVRKF
jgi:hypothetical protein